MSEASPALQLVQSAPERAESSTAEDLIEKLPTPTLDPRQALQDMRLERSLLALLARSLEPLGATLRDESLKDRYGDVVRQFTVVERGPLQICLLQIPQWIAANANKVGSIDEMRSTFEGRRVRLISQRVDSGTLGLKRMLGDWSSRSGIEARFVPWSYVRELLQDPEKVAEVLEVELPSAAVGAPAATPAARREPFVFVSYSHLDAEWLQEIQKQLKIHLRDEQFRAWDDTRIQPGALWDAEIQQALEAATVAVLLVSTNFLASSYVSDNELPVLLGASADRGLKLLWVLVSPCAFEKARLDRFQAVHDVKTSLQALKEESRAGLEAVLTDIGKAIARAASS